MPDRPEWYPVNPYHTHTATGYHDAYVWDKGVRAGVKALIERIETLCYAMDANTTWCMSSADWLQLRKEAGLD
mgnify:CR=1 FL=1